MSKRTRQRELARLRAQREAERQRARRRRALLSYGGLAVVIGAFLGSSRTVKLPQEVWKVAR